MEHFILRYGEIFLKGRNRSDFERRLAKNIKACLKQEDISGELEKVGSRFILEAEKEPRLQRVFGLISYSPCVKIKAEYESIEKEVLKIAKNLKKNTRFRISAHVANSKPAFSGTELNHELGEAVVNAFKLPVSLENFDVAIGVDILDNFAYIFTETKKCFGGLPVGSEGSLAAFIDGKNSVLAALLMMKRGCAVFPFAFKEQDISLLEKYSCGSNIKLRPVKDFAELNEMMKKYSLEAIVTGQSLEKAKELPVDMPVLRPLVGFDNIKIQKELKRFDI